MRGKLAVCLCMLPLIMSGCKTEDAGRLKEETMLVYQTGSDVLSAEMEAVLPELENRSTVFYLNRGQTEIVVYCDDTEMYQYETEDAYIHMFINEEEYILDNFGKDFYLREATPPVVIWYDWNEDGIDDFVFWSEGFSLGNIQYAFVSTEHGYENLGSTSWRFETEKNLSYENFPYVVTLLDDYMVKIEVESAGISETYKLTDETFLEYLAIPMGLFDESGKVTQAGKEWDFTPSGLYERGGLYERSIECIADEENGFIMRVEYMIGSGYSGIDIGCGFQFDWKITDSGYELIDVTSFSGSEIR